jgi:hypothetical protein
MGEGVFSLARKRYNMTICSIEGAMKAMREVE